MAMYARRSMPSAPAGRRQCAESLVTAQQDGGEPADAHAHDQRTRLDQYIPCEQDVEECLQV